MESTHLSIVVISVLLFVACLWYIAIPLLIIGAIIWLITAINKMVLDDNLRAWNLRHRNKVISRKSDHFIYQEMTTKDSIPYLKASKLSIRDSKPEMLDIEIKLNRNTINCFDSASTFRAILQESGIEFVNPLSVEENAMRTAYECIEEIKWGESASRRIEQFRKDIRETCSLAPGNPLLEPSLSQLLKAEQSFANEQANIQLALKESSEIFSNLVEYLSLPCSVKRLIEHQKPSLKRSYQLSELKQSFQDVIDHNNIYINLCNPSKNIL